MSLTESIFQRKKKKKMYKTTNTTTNTTTTTTNNNNNNNNNNTTRITTPTGAIMTISKNEISSKSNDHLHFLVSMRLYVTFFFGILLLFYYYLFVSSSKDYFSNYYYHYYTANNTILNKLFTPFNTTSTSSSSSSSSSTLHVTAFQITVVGPSRTTTILSNRRKQRTVATIISNNHQNDNNIYKNNQRYLCSPSNKLILSRQLQLSSTTTSTDSISSEINSSKDNDGGGNENSGVSSSSSTTTTTTITSFRAPTNEINRRRNLAIISHPDSGKTTMTEKLLLYGGAVQQAGMVRFKSDKGGGKSTTSDFMELEQQRGISISSTVLNFEYNNTYGIRLMDTPGHNDFSEDTYRALSAADNALMLLDGAKGLEPQTRKLFEVCRLRQIPIFTFVNKLDRPSLSPYTIMDQIEKEFQLSTYPILWPIGDGERFKGVLDRTTDIVHLYTKSNKRGGKASVETIHYDEQNMDQIQQLINDDELYNQLIEDYTMLHELIEPLDIQNKVMEGLQSPLFFGSAMTNFGVDLFLNHFVTMGAKPTGRPTTTTVIITNDDNNHNNNNILMNTIKTTDSNNNDDNKNENNGGTMTNNKDSLENKFVNPDHEEFTGFIFKTQANLDPKHRDRLAYVRIISGMYQKGMKVGHSRSKSNKRYTLAQAQTLLGADRTSIDVAYPGDVIGINNPGNFLIGDTLYTGNTPVIFPGIPSFSPEKFAYIRSPNPSDYKSFRKGIHQLLDEGAIQALRQRGSDDNDNNNMLLAAVGQLQFEVVQSRLKNEYNVDCIMEPISYTIARWVDGGWDAIKKADDDGKLFGTMIVQDRWNRPVILFRNDWKAAALEKEEKYLQLKPWSNPPLDY